ncbi:SusC/RagA family TonB-linked outer membrane protein [Pedobacter sp. UBA4863]|uniref:SusC/RagA family TonB-linked outer membrane protein n=1 Tax=Pedobacter sp. UBA4863 TaxID=1947060 RepID=UPI0025FEA905|nr:SusC/RagA family TonB-linked outer membrane protein [Pedobacter sp. UBA4863]
MKLYFKICLQAALVLVILVLTNGNLYAQKTITGRVTNDKGESLEGVTITMKNSKSATLSNQNGNYKIAVLDENSLLIFGYLGYERQEVRVGARNTINIILNSKGTQLEEVVVTALNISKEQRSLGYAAQTVDSTALTKAPSNNWMSGLEGRIAGLTLNSAGGAMGSTEIILRGEKSLEMGNSGALIVVDGVPISNQVPSQAGGAYNSVDSPMDIGSSAGDVNPEDIASVTILKGAAATALYGSRGANGAVVIVTKSGSTRKGLGITVNSNTDFSSVNRWFDYQTEYGDGVDSDIKHYSYGTSNVLSTSGSSNAWGPRLNTGVKYYQYDPATQGQGAEPTDWISYPDATKKFFRTGILSNNSIAIDGGNAQTKGRLSITNMQNRYILENVSNQKTTVSFSLDQQINKAMKIITKVNYYKSSSPNLPILGYNARSVSNLLAQTPPNIDIELYRDYWRVINGIRQVDVAQNRPFNTNVDNPYFVLYEMLNTANRDGAFGNINYSYKINNYLNFTARTGINMYTDITSNRQPKSSRSWIDGFYREQNDFRYEINADVLLTYKRPLSKKISSTFSIGGNNMRNNFNRTIAYIDRMLIPGEYTLINGINRAILRTYREQKGISSVYAFANLSYKNYLFLELTGRNDWSSSLPTNNNSYFYPSANLSLVLTDMLAVKTNVLSFAKLRLSYAEVGSDTNPYRIDKYFSSSDFNASITNPTTLPNPELKPMRTKSFEAGLEARLLKSRIGIDATYYQSKTIDQILSVPVDPASGFYNFIMNTGLIENKGVELQLWGKVLQSNTGLNWRINFNAAANRSLIKNLNDKIETIKLYSFGTTALLAKEGGSLGDLWGAGYSRNPEGKIIYENGFPMYDTENPIYLGNANPKFKGGIGSEFTYKGWSLSFLFDAEFGHKKFSLTNSELMVGGMIKATLPGREEGAIIGTGVVLQPDGSWLPNTTPVKPSAYYLSHYDYNNGEANIFDASYIKLREFRVDKTIDTKYARKIGANRITVGVYGRNLFVISKWPSFDPQSSTFSNGTMVQGIEIGQMPSTRNIGVNLRLTL